MDGGADAQYIAGITKGPFQSISNKNDLIGNVERTDATRPFNPHSSASLGAFSRPVRGGQAQTTPNSNSIPGAAHWHSWTVRWVK